MDDEHTKPAFKRAKNNPQTSKNQSSQGDSVDPEETKWIVKKKPVSSNDEQTVLYRQTTADISEQNESCELTPVVGWLVVTEGAGRGEFVQLGYGQNTVGRGGGSKEPRLTVNFGDSGISREKQFMVAYDSENRTFKIIPGDSVNITYLNDKAIYSAHDLQSKDLIKVSATTFRFISFCDELFDWDT